MAFHISRNQLTVELANLVGLQLTRPHLNLLVSPMNTARTEALGFLRPYPRTEAPSTPYACCTRIRLS